MVGLSVVATIIGIFFGILSSASIYPIKAAVFLLLVITACTCISGFTLGVHIKDIKNEATRKDGIKNTVISGVGIVIGTAFMIIAIAGCYASLVDLTIK